MAFVLFLFSSFTHRAPRTSTSEEIQKENSGKFANAESLLEFRPKQSTEMICLEVKDHAIETNKLEI